MKRTLIHIVTFLLIVFIAYQPQSNYFSMNNLSNYMQLSQQVTSNQDQLMADIKKKSQEYEEPPQNARVDEVWKKLPGRNGIRVNIEESYKQMKENGKFDESLLVYEQVRPEVSIEDLPPSPIYRGHPDKQMVALLINVAWGEENIPSMLNTLKKNSVKATFFIEGKWASNNADLVKMIKEEGHLIGNHAFNHPDMKHLTKEQNLEQIKKTNDIIKAIIGEAPKWFAPPSGSFNDEVVKIASELKMETILWSVDTVDWKKPSTSVMLNRVISNIHPGAMILMHPTDVIEQGIEQLILNLKEKGYKIGTVDRLLSENR
ncbi:polysaccharide deacetylase family protein [Radiobacillus sp. PE A8.2]|uniref:polysaccharide deacetylase family protein n=1 Tax=Radiobacillus sp. PE A8.2 TaxID=3380349 RepID=UPI00388F2AEB